MEDRKRKLSSINQRLEKIINFSNIKIDKWNPKFICMLFRSMEDIENTKELQNLKAVLNKFPWEIFLEAKNIINSYGVNLK